MRAGSACIGRVFKVPLNLSGKSILRGQAVGFTVLIGLMWLAEYARLPHLLYGEEADFRWMRVLLRTWVVLIIWIPVHLTTTRLLKRLHELEEFLLICSWCRKVGHKGEWLTMEEYFDTHFKTETSHGICPACAKKQLAQHYAATRVNPPKREDQVR